MRDSERQKHRRVFMPNFAPARHAELIKYGHTQADSADQELLRTVEAHCAVKFEQTSSL